MAHGVFIHRSDSIYDDVPSQQYHFPRSYLGRVSQTVGDWIVYLEPSKVRETRGYFAVARVQTVVPDPVADGMFMAVIEPGTYLDFGRPVAFRDGDGIVERSVLNEAGKISGRAQSAVRIIPPSDFARIVERGLTDEDQVLPRIDDALPLAGFADEQTGFAFDEDRLRRATLVNLKVRRQNFRRIVLDAYDERCAITGLKLINGGGRAEVEAAHIRPVEHNGPDMVSNGIALSGTVHWMFDRGLIGLGDDLHVLVSRQVNDSDAVHGMINRTGSLMPPKRPTDGPHPSFVRWHRENCFKH